MVKKKKGLHLGLLLSFIGVANVMQAYKITVKNKTPYRVKFSVDYSAAGLCPTYSKKLSPGKSKKFGSGACVINKVQADVYEPGSAVTAKKYYAPLGRTGNSVFLIKQIEVKGRIKYTVERKK